MLHVGPTLRGRRRKLSFTRITRVQTHKNAILIFFFFFLFIFLPMTRREKTRGNNGEKDEEEKSASQQWRKIYIVSFC